MVANETQEQLRARLAREGHDLAFGEDHVSDCRKCREMEKDSAV